MKCNSNNITIFTLIFNCYIFITASYYFLNKPELKYHIYSINLSRLKIMYFLYLHFLKSSLNNHFIPETRKQEQGIMQNGIHSFNKGRQWNGKRTWNGKRKGRKMERRVSLKHVVRNFHSNIIYVCMHARLRQRSFGMVISIS